MADRSRGRKILPRYSSWCFGLGRRDHRRRGDAGRRSHAYFRRGEFGLGACRATSAVRGAPSDLYVDDLLRADPIGGQNASSNDSTRAEVARILTPAVAKGGDVSAADRGYLAKVVAVRTGLPQAEAEQRVNQSITQAKAAAAAARKSAAKFSLWLVASMLAGAVAAGLGAVEGGSLRNREWYLKGR